MNKNDTNIIDAGFIGIFKLGDNINYNFGVLKVLYKNDRVANEYSLNKPITIIIISIIEALLYDFHFKASLYTREGIENISDKILNYIRRKKIDIFDKHIKSAKKHNIFGVNDVLYTDLETLRKLRNRIHIQNAKNDFEPEEHKAFSTDRKVLAEKTLERIIRLMSEKHNRGFQAVNHFILPWSPHFAP